MPAPNNQSEEVSGLVKADGPLYFMDLANRYPADAEELLVHVDLLTPFADLSISSEQDLAAKIQGRIFAEYPGVVSAHFIVDMRRT